MKKTNLILQSCVLLMGVGIFGISISQADTNGFWDAGSDKKWQANDGECWRTIGWTTDTTDCAERPTSEKETVSRFFADDQDMDGVADANDNCPLTPSVIKVNDVGCPFDDDNDGVPNYLDQCLSTPSGSTVDTDGCQIKKMSNQTAQTSPMPVSIDTVPDILFQFDSANLSGAAKVTLDKMLSSIKEGRVSFVSIKGYTDSIGSNTYNDRLSKRRAQAVANYLIQNGVSPSVINVSGQGKSNPVASNDTDEGRYKNRRAELILR